MTDAIKSEDLIYSCNAGIAHLTIARAEAMNAINIAIRRALIDAIGRAEADDAVRVILIKAEGERAFSVGADIREQRDSSSLTAARSALIDLPWIETVARARKPVIAAIQGYCMGGGMELALACDIRMAAPGATFALPEVNLGLLPGGGGTQRLMRLIGFGRALDLMITGDRLDAEAAKACGLITRISSSAAALHAEAEALARSIAAKPPVAVRHIKEAATRGRDVPLAQGIEIERDLFTLLLSTSDRVEAARAFAEKRPGVFCGQ